MGITKPASKLLDLREAALQAATATGKDGAASTTGTMIYYVISPSHSVTTFLGSEDKWEKLLRWSVMVPAVCTMPSPIAMPLWDSFYM